METGTRADSLTTLSLPNGRSVVPDGFFHSALINKSDKRAWMLRVGGFPSVYEWYGPVEMENIDLKGCTVDPAEMLPLRKES